MRNTARLGAILILAVPAASQWNTVGTDIYYDKGLVGIGLGTPSAGQLQLATYDQDWGIYVNNFNTLAKGGIYSEIQNGGNPYAIAIHGRATASPAAKTVGVYGEVFSYNGRGVWGAASNKKGGRGVFGTASNGYGVWGEAVNTGTGVYGTGVRAVHGESFAGNGTGVRGSSHGYAGEAMVAVAYGAEGRGIWAIGEKTAVHGQLSANGVAGVHGEGYKSAPAVLAEGDFVATGVKAFAQPHPTDPSLVVRFVCLEGNEAGTYFRGTTRLVDGTAEIAIPAEWQAVTDEGGVTVHLTPVRSFASLTVWETSRDHIVVAGTEDCEFNYWVHGVRRGFTNYEATIPNKVYRPQFRGVPFGAQYPNDLRQILVENGTLNPDFTPNENTASRLEWELRDRSDTPVEGRTWLRREQRRALALTETR